MTWWDERDQPTRPMTPAAAPTKVCPRCSAQAQTASTICPFCGASYIRDEPPPARPDAIVVFPRNVPRWIVSAAVGIVILIGIAWSSGSLDPWVARFGLNTEPCIENYITGNVICGDKARDFCDRLRRGSLHLEPPACKDL